MLESTQSQLYHFSPKIKKAGGWENEADPRGLRRTRLRATQSATRINSRAVLGSAEHAERTEPAEGQGTDVTRGTVGEEMGRREAPGG
jgi:hypothetical protein